ncbi:DUF2953 domain-containing protein [bacterium C-53]|nr:DUF2953 domain-containing protein [Lachnospiraceae bacterium]NBI01845.1 DUF2953 domain-containing protein [Lachnospiraceae bacterium]RKJ12256.1 DUF2953 domain-containing protein [bacterium C-53]
MILTLLTIAKGIGVFLLVLLLLLIFLLCLVIFVPVRYMAKAEKRDKTEAFLRFHWLCRILSFQLSYDDGVLLTRLKIFGISWKKKEKKASEAVFEAEKAVETTEETIRDVDIEAAEDTQTENSQEVLPDIQAETETDASEDEFQFAKESERNQGKTLWQRILDKIRKIWYTITSICDKILQIKDHISEYLAIWRAEETQEAFVKCKKELVRLLRHLKPKKLKAEITFGMDDPALTGEFFGALSIFYAYIGKNVVIHPDFENVVFSGTIFIKGRIRTGTLLLIAGRLYFDKNIRKLIQKFRKEEADG